MQNVGFLMTQLICFSLPVHYNLSSFYSQNLEHLAIFCGFKAWFVVNHIENPEDRFCRNEVSNNLPVLVRSSQQSMPVTEDCLPPPSSHGHCLLPGVVSSRSVHPHHCTPQQVTLNWNENKPNFTCHVLISGHI